jgi:L-fuconolactonase
VDGAEPVNDRAAPNDAVIIDAHHHLWDLTRGYDWLDEPAMAPIRRSYGLADLVSVTTPVTTPGAAATVPGVQRTVLVEAGRCDVTEAAEFLALAADSQLIAGVVAWAPLADPRLEEVLEAYLALPGSEKLVGIRDQVQGHDDPDYLDRPEVRAGLATVADAGLVNELVVRADQLPSCGRAALALPEAVFVLDHLGKPAVADGAEGLARWRSAIAEYAAQPNAHAKLSGLVTEADWASWTVEDLRPFAHAALELFGAERLMFGSDWPVCELAASYAQVLEAARDLLGGLDDARRAAVLGANAVRIYGLSV